MFIPPSPLDLGSLSGCKAWIGGVSGSSQDANIQACLTAASVYILRMTGRGPRNWQTATESPFNQPVGYMETYDGIAGNKLWLRNFPITEVASVVVGAYTVPQSTGPSLPGWAIDDQGRAIVLRNGGAGMSPQTFQYVGRYGNGFMAGSGAVFGGRGFAAGPQQIQIGYTAGFNTIPVTNSINTVIEGWQASTGYATGDTVSDGTNLQQALNSGTTGSVAPPWAAASGGKTTDNTISWKNTGIAAAPNTLSIESDANVLSDEGVKYFSSGTPFVKVLISPSVGEYFLVAPGNYLFNVADAGVEVLVNYTLAGTPPDLILACFQLVALNYQRRNWVGVRSIAMKDVGSTSYTLAIDPGIQQVISNYTRASLSS